MESTETVGEEKTDKEFTPTKGPEKGYRDKSGMCQKDPLSLYLTPKLMVDMRLRRISVWVRSGRKNRGLSM